MDKFTQAYIECLLWSSTAYCSPEEEKADPEHDGTFDASFQTCRYDIFTPDAMESIKADCADFQSSNAELLEKWYSECGESDERAGHDFWLTRNHHGTGFWDRWNGITPQGKIGRALTEAAHAYGGVMPYWTEGGIALQ